jgi:hypothetical protein
LIPCAWRDLSQGPVKTVAQALMIALMVIVGHILRIAWQCLPTGEQIIELLRGLCNKHGVRGVMALEFSQFLPSIQ